MGRTLLASLLVLAAGLAGLVAATDGLRAFTTETARRLAIEAQPRALPPARLQRADGTALRLEDLRGQWVLVDFVYTRCLTWCSVQGAEFAQLQRQLEGPLARGEVTLLSVSFDPEHDDPAALHAWRQRMGGKADAGWVAARPVAADELQALLQAFGVKAIPDGLGGWVHNAAINVVDPAGNLVGVLDADAVGEARQWLQTRLAAR